MPYSSPVTDKELKLLNRLELAIEGSGFGIWEFDLNRGLLIWDKKMHEVYGHTHAPFSGVVDEWKKMVHPDDIEVVDRKFNELMNGVKVEVFEFRIFTPITNELRYIEGNGILEKNSSGQPLLLLGMNRDVSAVKKLSLELEEEKMTRMAYAKFAAMGEMAAGIAHEINNPLAILLGYKQKLKKQILAQNNFTPEIEHSLSTIEKTIDRMSQIIKGLLRFAGKDNSINYEVKKISEYVEETLQFLNERILKNEIKISISEHLKSKDLYLKSTACYFSQVLFNILSNSIDAIENLDDKWILIDIQSLNSDFAVISITDSGLGIKPEDLNKIAKPFFTTKLAGKGSGLGLSICKKILNDLGGQLEYNRHSKHTQFLIKIPLIKPESIKKTA